MPANIGSYVELGDLFPGEECSVENLRDCLAPLPLNLVLVMCTRANQVLSGPRRLTRLDRQRSLANTLLTAETGARLNEVARTRDENDPEKTAFLTRKGLLELVRWALLLCDPNTPPLEGKWTQTEKDLFTKAALICSWASETRIRAVLEENADFEALKDIALVFFRTALDAGMSGVDPWRVVGRGKKLFLEYLPKHYPDLDSDFREATGVSPLEYMTAAGALISMHLQLENTMVLSDAITLGHDTEYAAVFKAYQAHQIWKLDDLRERLWPGNRPPNFFDAASGFSLRPLRERPIIALDDGRGVIPDPLLLADSYMVGPLFQLLGVRDANEVFGHFGDAFEEYAGDILDEVFPAGVGLHRILYRDVALPDADGRKFQIDACLDYVDQLVLLEAKAVFIPDAIVVECDETAFQAELRKKYLYWERPVGVGQLARAIRSLAAGRWKGLDPSSCLRLVYPVLVVHDRLLQEPLVTSFLADLLVGKLDASQAPGSWQWETNGLRFAPLTILTIDDLENLESSPGIDFLDLLQSYSSDVPKRNESLHDYIASTERFRDELRINQILANAAKDFLADCVRRVFGREPRKR
jgi:hypothetical protein